MTKTALAILAAISTLPVIIACALLDATQAGAATCMENPSVCQPFVVTIDQVGNNVVATGSGEFDLTGLPTSSTGGVAASVHPSDGFIGLSNSPPPGFVTDEFLGPGSGPTSFGSGGLTDGSGSGADVRFVLILLRGVLTAQLGVPIGYTSGTVLSDQDIFNNTTLAGLGITPGTYKSTWGGAAFADQSFTIDAIAPTTPLPATLPLFATGLGALGLLGWRRKRKQAVA